MNHKVKQDPLLVVRKAERQQNKGMDSKCTSQLFKSKKEENYFSRLTQGR